MDKLTFLSVYVFNIAIEKTILTAWAEDKGISNG